MRSNGLKVFAAIALTLASSAVCGAQSHDPQHPTPLGPGVNKGNVDNKANGPNYYYFYAGPGHVDLHYSFKEMGVFGNPFKQALSFDIFDENNTLMNHCAIVSVEKMESQTESGNLPSRHRVTLRVISPSTALRLGGYYAIEVTGAASFEGKATRADVKPESTTLYRSQYDMSKPASEQQGPVSLYGPETSLYKGGGSLYKGGGSLYRPGGALTKVQDSPKELRLTLAADILFDFDKSSIRPDAREALDRVAEIIRSQSQGVVRIEGFTDSKGETGYNLRLSQARAQSVENWMIEHEGRHGAGFTTQGYGATRFVAPNTKPDGSDDPAGRQKNRRVEIVLQKRT
jgi:outer membrane protein OmpA-like peptidoglycan-associated protein